MLKLVDYILVYGARRLLMLDGDSLRDQSLITQHKTYT